MTQLRLDFMPYEVKLKQPLVTARATVTRRLGWTVKVWDASGRFGYGEVAPLPWFGTEGEHEAARGLESLRATGLPAPDGLDSMRDTLAASGVDRERRPALHAGVETALLDLLARSREQSLATWLSPDAADRVAVQRLVSGQTPGEVVREAVDAHGAGYRTFKLKVAALPLERDVERIRAIRIELGPHVRLRLDANGGWSPEEARRALEAIAPHGIDLLEQPVTSSDPADFVALRHRGVPIAADEAMIDPTLASRLIETEAIDAVVLKPSALGGLSRSVDLARAVQRHGMRTIVTTSLERAIGVAAAVHLACAIAPDEVHGLGTLDWLESDDATRCPVFAGGIRRPPGPGLGLEGV